MLKIHYSLDAMGRYMYKFVPPFELKDSILKKTVAFGGIAAISTFETHDLFADEDES